MQSKYRKVKYDYDKEKLLEEIYKHEDMFFKILALKENFKKRPFSIVPEDYYDKVESREPYGPLDGKRIEGSISTWKGFNFTHIPGEPVSKYGRNSNRLTHENWEWRPDVECDYLKKIVNDLGFVSIQNVRVMTIYPGGFGPVHIDASPESLYYDNHISITLNVEDGGQPLVAQIDGSLYEFNDRCFIFKDDCWHGVGLVNSRRTQIRINGTVDQKILNMYLE